MLALSSSHDHRLVSSAQRASVMLCPEGLHHALPHRLSSCPAQRAIIMSCPMDGQASCPSPWATWAIMSFPKGYHVLPQGQASCLAPRASIMTCPKGYHVLPQGQASCPAPRAGIMPQNHFKLETLMNVDYFIIYLCPYISHQTGIFAPLVSFPH